MGPTGGLLCPLEQSWRRMGFGKVGTHGREAEHRAWCWDMEDSYSHRKMPHQTQGDGELLGPEPRGRVIGRKLQRWSLQGSPGGTARRDGGEDEPLGDLPTVAWLLCMYVCEREKSACAYDVSVHVYECTCV